MMRLLGGWIALTPELDVKLLFGRHVWDCAQHADLWGRRLPELRAPAQQSEPANDAVVAFVRLMGTVEGPSQTVERVTAVYGVLKPHLATVYERHLAVTNPVYEPPTRRILARCVEEERRHAAAGAHVLERLLSADPSLAARARAWERRLLDALAGARGITGDVEAPLIVPPAVEPDFSIVSQDLVPPPPSFDDRAALGDLADPVETHRRALAAGDAAALRDVVTPAGRSEAAEDLARLEGPFERVDVVGCARLGRHRVVKLRLDGPRAVVVLQERWVPTERGWRIAAVEVTRADRAS
jgi:hypothetical protein